MKSSKFKVQSSKFEGAVREDRASVKREVLGAFAGLGDAHPVWVALNKLLAIHLDVEHRAAKQYGPGTDAALRDFNSGREAGLEDFRNALWKLRAEARGGSSKTDGGSTESRPTGT